MSQLHCDVIVVQYCKLFGQLLVLPSETHDKFDAHKGSDTVNAEISCDTGVAFVCELSSSTSF